MIYNIRKIYSDQKLYFGHKKLLVLSWKVKFISAKFIWATLYLIKKTAKHRHATFYFLTQFKWNLGDIKMRIFFHYIIGISKPMWSTERQSAYRFGVGWKGEVILFNFLSIYSRWWIYSQNFKNIRMNILIKHFSTNITQS